MGLPATNAAGLPQWDKDPDAVKDYTLDWADWLVTDTIASSTWSVPSGLSKVSDAHTTSLTSIWLSGGSLGVEYVIRNTIVTAGGRTEVRSFELGIKSQ
jgi:hypothetical protein